MPEDHEGREIYGLVKDPNPDKGRVMGKLLEKRAAEAAEAEKDEAD